MISNSLIGTEQKKKEKARVAVHLIDMFFPKILWFVLWRLYNKYGNFYAFHAMK